MLVTSLPPIPVAEMRMREKSFLFFSCCYCSCCCRKKPSGGAGAIDPVSRSPMARVSVCLPLPSLGPNPHLPLPAQCRSMPWKEHAQLYSIVVRSLQNLTPSFQPVFVDPKFGRIVCVLYLANRLNRSTKNISCKYSIP